MDGSSDHTSVCGHIHPHSILRRGCKVVLTEFFSGRAHSLWFGAQTGAVGSDPSRWGFLVATLAMGIWTAHWSPQDLSIDSRGIVLWWTSMAGEEGVTGLNWWLCILEWQISSFGSSDALHLQTFSWFLSTSLAVVTWAPSPLLQNRKTGGAQPVAPCHKLETLWLKGMNCGARILVAPSAGGILLKQDEQGVQCYLEYFCRNHGNSLPQNNSGFAVWELILQLLKQLLVAYHFPSLELPEEMKPSTWILVWEFGHSTIVASEEQLESNFVSQISVHADERACVYIIST